MNKGLSKGRISMVVLERIGTQRRLIEKSCIKYINLYTWEEKFIIVENIAHIKGSSGLLLILFLVCRYHV